VNLRGTDGVVGIARAAGYDRATNRIDVTPDGPGCTCRFDRARSLASATAVLVVVWFAAILLTPWIRFVIYTPRAKTGFDVTLSILSLFVALVLALFPNEGERDRLRWLALGFTILGVGGLIFGYLAPLFDATDGLGQAMYCSLAVRSAALMAMAIGLAMPAVPSPDRGNLLAMSGVAVGLAAIAILFADQLPTLAHVDDLAAAARQSDATLGGLTTAHWLLSAVPLGLAVAAAIGLIRNGVAYTGQVWLAVGMVLMAGSQLHTMFWPSAFSPVLTTASILRLAFTLAVVFGAVFALRGVAEERAAVLAAERELGTRMAELARLRADFTAMVAHELAAPAAVLKGYAAMLTTGSLDYDRQKEAATAIQDEAELIATLIEDVRSAASAELDDFSLRIVPTAVAPLLADAAEYALSQPGEHPVSVSCDVQARILADPERLGQVLRNLVSNACKHTPPGTSVSLKVCERNDRVRIEVADDGPGIHPDDLGRIFEKFGRGRDAVGERVPGVGLGLYLSRRIIQSHGGRLGVESKPGKGATFWVELPHD
jgi:signal transduction histidine kinase